MAFTKANSAEIGQSASATTVVTGTIAVTAGSLLVAFIKHEGAATTITASGGGNTWTGLTKTSHANNDTHGQWFYVLSAASGTYGVTGTFGASVPFRSAILYEFTITGGTVTWDTEAGTSGTSTAPNTGNMTTTGSDELVVVGYAEYSTVTPTSRQVNGVAADGSVDVSGGVNFTCSWYRAVAATFTGAGSGTLASSEAWILRAAAFKIGGGGGGGGTAALSTLTMLGVQ